MYHILWCVLCHLSVVSRPYCMWRQRSWGPGFFAMVVCINWNGHCRDAEDAVRGRDGYTFDGYRIRVEFPRASSRGEGSGRGGYGGRGRAPGSGPGRPGYRPKGYQLIVSGLPPTGSWQVRLAVSKNWSEKNWSWEAKYTAKNGPLGLFCCKKSFICQVYFSREKIIN